MLSWASREGELGDKQDQPDGKAEEGTKKRRRPSRPKSQKRVKRTREKLDVTRPNETESSGVKVIVRVG